MKEEITILNTDQPIYHINQDRFRAQISSRVQKNDNITKYYASESPIKNYSIAQKEKQNSIERIVEKNVDEFNKCREVYELGVYKTRADNTKFTKTINLNQKEEWSNKIINDWKLNLSQEMQIAQQDRLQSLVEREKEIQAAKLKKSIVNQDLKKQMKEDKDR